jgi:PAS domain S-box-containing protein
MLMRFFEHEMDYVLFFYGIVLIVVGLVCCVRGRERENGLSWRWLGIAAILSGIDKWVSMAIVLCGHDFDAAAIRLVTTTVGSLALLEFARQGHARVFGKGPGWWIYIPLVILAGLGAASGNPGLAVSTRYVLGLPAASWAAMVMAGMSRARRPASKTLLTAAAAMLAFGIATAVLVPRGPFFPASVVNQEWFMAVTGIPIYALRSTIAIFMMVTIWVYHQRSTYGSVANNPTLGQSPLGPGFAIVILLVLGAGWAFTAQAGRYAADQIRSAMANGARIASASIDESRVRRLSGTAADVDNPDYIRISQQLADIARSTGRTMHLDLMRPAGGSFVFLASSVPSNQPGGHGPGAVYEHPAQELFSVMAQNEEMVIGPYKDDGGTFVSELVPLSTEPGSPPYAILRIDTNATDWQKNISRLRLAAILMVLVVVAVFIIAGMVWQQVWASSQAVVANEHRLREAQKVARLGSWTYDVGTRQYAYSDEVVRIFGYDPSAGTTTGDLHRCLSDEDLTALQRGVKRAAEEGITLTLEMPMGRADGTNRHIVWRATPIKDDREEVVQLFGTIQDITEHKQMEESLRSTQSLLSDAMDLAGLVHWEYDVTLDMFRLNDRIYSILGTSAEREGGYMMSSATLIRKLVHRDDAATVASAIERAVKSVEHDYRQQLDVRFVRVDGSLRNCVVRLMTVRDENGRVNGLRGSSQDVTEKKQADDSLRESQRRLSDIMEFYPDATMVIDSEGRVVTWNKAMEQLTGVKAEDMLGKGNYECALPFYGIRRPTLAHAAIHADKDILSTYVSARWSGEVLTAESYAPSVRGGKAYLFASAAVLRNLRGEVVAAVESIRDITERKRMEEALRVNESQLSDAMELAHLAYWEYNLATSVFSFNNRFYSLYGTTAEREGGYAMPFDVYTREFLPEDDAALLRAEIGLAAASAQTDYFSQIHHRMTRRDGQVRSMAVRLHVIKDAAGKAVKCYGVNQDVTEQITMQEAMKKSLSLQHATLESTADGILVVDSNGHITSFNQRFIDMWRIPSDIVESHSDERALQHVMSQLKDPQQFVARVRDLYSRPNDESFDVLEFTDGRVFERYSQAQLIDGKYGGRVWSFRDVTEKKRTEEELRRQEAAMASFFLAAPTGIGVVRKRVLVQANDKLCAMTGYQAGELIGQSARILYLSQEEFDRVGRDKYGQIAQHGTGTVETTWRRKDGTVIDVLLSSTPMYAGNLDAEVTFTALDITRRKQAEEALRHEHDLVSRIAETSPAGIMALDRNGIVVFANKTAEQLLGLTRDGSGGQAYSAAALDIGDGDGRLLKDSELPFSRVRATGQPVYNAFHTVEHSDGRRLILSFNAAPLFTSTGDFDGMVAVFEDITDSSQDGWRPQDAAS